MKEKIYHYSKKMLQHELIRGSSFLFLGSFFANVLAFLFNLLVVRKLSTGNYGEYASLMSLFGLAIMPAGSLTTIIVKFATDLLAKDELSKAKKLYVQMSLFLGVCCIGIILAIVLGTSGIKSFLHIQNGTYIVFVGIIIAISYISIVNMAFLQSILRFDLIASITLLAALIKLIAGYSVILLNLSLFGIFSAILLSSIVQYLLPFFPLRFVLKEKSANYAVPLNQLLKYALPASITVFALSSLTSTDVILAKHFFTPVQAGLYAGLSLVGKVIFYFTVPISSVMFPLLIKRYHKGENVFSLLLLSLCLVLIPGLLISAGYFLSPSLVIQIFLGGKQYLSVSQYVGYFGLYLAIFSTINVLVNFFLSLNKTGVTYPIAAVAIAQIVLISLFHSNFMQLIGISISLSLALVVLLLLYYGKVYAQIKKQESTPLPNYPSL